MEFPWHHVQKAMIIAMVQCWKNMALQAIYKSNLKGLFNKIVIIKKKILRSTYYV